MTSGRGRGDGGKVGGVLLLGFVGSAMSQGLARVREVSANPWGNPLAKSATLIFLRKKGWFCPPGSLRITLYLSSR